MSKGRTHQKGTAGLAIVSAVLCVSYGFSWWLLYGVLTGFILQPDLDVDKGSITNHVIRSIPVIGNPLEWAWFRYWYLYAVFCKHRGMLSHQFILSTLIRFAYAFWWLYFVPGAVIHDEFIVGLIASDTLHILFDAWSEFVDGFRLLGGKIKK